MLFEKTYGIDLGSSSVKVYSFFRNKTYIEKNMIASKGHTIIAMGNEAYDMFEKSPTDITVTSPMTFGMIANLELQEIVLYSMIRKIDHILGFGATMYFTVPLDMTAVEKRAYFHVANGHWLKKNRVFMVEAPIADAIAMGVNLEDPEGNMIVNIGAQSTEVSIITGGKIIISRKIPLGGRQMNESVCSEIRKRYNLQIGTRTAKRLKMVMGRLSDPKKEVRKVVGIDCISGLGAHLLPATGKLKKLPTMARAVNTPARASRLVREESDDKVVCVINKHSFHKKIPFIHKADGGYKK